MSDTTSNFTLWERIICLLKGKVVIASIMATAGAVVLIVLGLIWGWHTIIYPQLLNLVAVLSIVLPNSVST